MSSWSGQLCGKEGYFLQFETKDYETYRRVEKLCQNIMDEEHGRKPRKFHDFCSVCGKEELKEDLYIRDGKWICPDCDKLQHPEDYDDEEDISNPLTGYYQPKFILEEDKIVDTAFVPETCRHCSNHPSNGGLGLCNCTLGQYSVNTVPRAPETICESVVTTNTGNYTIATNEFTEEEFVETYCHNCGSQRCEGIGTEWFDGCHYRHELKGYEEWSNKSDKFNHTIDCLKQGKLPPLNINSENTEGLYIHKYGWT